MTLDAARRINRLCCSFAASKENDVSYGPVKAPITMIFTGSPLGAAGASVPTGVVSVAAEVSGALVTGVVGVVAGASEAGGEVARAVGLVVTTASSENSAGTASRRFDLSAWRGTFMARRMSYACSRLRS